MKIQCDINNSLPKNVRDVAERRAAFKLDRFSALIEDVKIVFQDINGPRGGIDTQCLVWVRMSRLPEVIIKERAENVGKALYLALERAAQNVARISHKRSRKHQTSPRRLNYLMGLE